jgi:hypothetical protein
MNHEGMFVWGKHWIAGKNIYCSIIFGFIQGKKIIYVGGFKDGIGAKT